MSQQTVTNSTCLIGLEPIGRLDLLPVVFSKVTIPLAVQAEVGLSADWLTLKAVQNLAVVATLKTQIDDGEAEAIAHSATALALKTRKLGSGKWLQSGDRL